MRVQHHISCECPDCKPFKSGRGITEVKIALTHVGKNNIILDYELWTRTPIAHKLLSEDMTLYNDVCNILKIAMEKISDEMSILYERKREAYGETLRKPNPL